MWFLYMYGTWYTSDIMFLSVSIGRLSPEAIRTVLETLESKGVFCGGYFVYLLEIGLVLM